MAVTDGQGRGIQVYRAVNQQFGGGQRHTAVILIQPGFNQIMRFKAAHHGTAALDNDPVTQPNAQVSTVR